MRYPKLSAAIGSATLFLGGAFADAPDSAPLTALAPPSHQASAPTPPEAAALRQAGLADGSGVASVQVSSDQQPGQPGLPRRAAVARVIYRRLLARFDREGRGYLTPEEQAQALAALAQHRPRIYAALVRYFDRNGDGKLDAGEEANLFATLARISASPPPVAE
jgi:hypothetical protein